MPWRQTDPMDQRLGLIADWLRSESYITDLSKRYEVSRKTVYKWIGRRLVEADILRYLQR